MEAFNLLKMLTISTDLSPVPAVDKVSDLAENHDDFMTSQDVQAPHPASGFGA